MLALALNAAKVLRSANLPVPRIIITHGDTGIENPMVSALARSEMAKARAFGQEHGLDVVAEVAEPPLNEQWAVAVLSGRRLPTFTNSSSRDCTINFKINPMLRLRKRLLAEGARDGERRPVTLIGTRFEESSGRAARMSERGESALLPWEKDGALYLSPIANWSTDDVWAYLGRLRAGDITSYTDGQDVFDMYAQAGGSSCAVVADMATESAKKSRACGARFGCSLCAAVGRDKSLENLLEADPAYAWLRPLNALQRFIVETQYDFTRRNWLGRTLEDDGWLKVFPSAYSPAMLRELLRYALTVDVLEQEAARKAKLDGPRFQLVPPAALVAIDAQWSLHAMAKRPFAAIAIWREVYVLGKRYRPPANQVHPLQPFPAPKYLYVGNDWDDGAGGRSDYHGMRDGLRELAATDSELSGHRDLPDGRRMLTLESTELFDVDPQGAELFLELQALDVLRDYHDGRPTSGARAFFHYAGLGILSTFSRHQHMLDKVMRRATWKRSEGLDGHVELDELLARAVTQEQREAMGPMPDSPGPEQPVPLRERLCRPMYI